MDQADIADQVITDNLERAIAAARGIRADSARFSLSSLYCIECGTQIPEKRKAAIPGCKRCVSCEEDYGLQNRGVIELAVDRDAVDIIIDYILMTPL